jgi:hypothetical protein
MPPIAIMVLPAPGRACAPWTAISVITVCPIEKPWPGCIANSGAR